MDLDAARRLLLPFGGKRKKVDRIMAFLIDHPDTTWAEFRVLLLYEGFYQPDTEAET